LSVPIHLPRDPQFESRVRDGFMRAGSEERHVFTMLATMIAVQGRDGISD
jgi:hypothetical protein